MLNDLNLNNLFHVAPFDRRGTHTHTHIIEFPLNLKRKAHSLDENAIFRGSASGRIFPEESFFLNYWNTWVIPESLYELSRSCSNSLFLSSKPTSNAKDSLFQK